MVQLDHPRAICFKVRTIGGSIILLTCLWVRLYFGSPSCRSKQHEYFTGQKVECHQHKPGVHHINRIDCRQNIKHVDLRNETGSEDRSATINMVVFNMFEPTNEITESDRFHVVTLPMKTGADDLCPTWTSGQTSKVWRFIAVHISIIWLVIKPSVPKKPKDARQFKDHPRKKDAWAASKLCFTTNQIQHDPTSGKVRSPVVNHRPWPIPRWNAVAPWLRRGVLLALNSPCRKKRVQWWKSGHCCLVLVVLVAGFSGSFCPCNLQRCGAKGVLPATLRPAQGTAFHFYGLVSQLGNKQW